MFEKRKSIIQIILKVDLAIRQIGVKGPAQEIHLLYIKWEDGCHQILTDVINKTTTMFPSVNKNKTRAFVSFVGLWRMHILCYSQLVRRLCLVN